MVKALPAALDGTARRRAPIGYQWYVLALLFLGSLMNTIDKQLVPALAEPLRIEFGLSDTELGFLAGLAFSIAYALAAIPLGLLIDRVNRSRLLAGLLAVWSLLTIASSRANSFLALAVCRMGIAAAESGGNPTSLSLISDYFPRMAPAGCTPGRRSERGPLVRTGPEQPQRPVGSSASFAAAQQQILDAHIGLDGSSLLPNDFSTARR